MSALSVGGLVKHVAAVEQAWAGFMTDGASAMPYDAVDWDDLPPEAIAAYADGFRLLPGETLADVLAEYEDVAARTDALVTTLDLDADHALPSAPWFTPGARWSVRRVVTHIVAETAQHVGHADIIRETIDGHKTMG